MSIKVRPLGSNYTPERHDALFGKLSAISKSPLQSHSPQTGLFTTDQSPQNSANRKDEMEYWKQKAQQNSQLVEELTRLSAILSQYKKDEYFKDPSRINEYIRENEDTMKKYHQTQLEEIAFLKEKLQKLENEKFSQEPNGSTKNQTHNLQQRINELVVLVQDQQQQLDRRQQPKSHNERENPSELKNLIDHYEKILSFNKKECERLNTQIRDLEHQMSLQNKQVSQPARLTFQPDNPQIQLLEQQIQDLENQRLQDNYQYQQEFDRLKQYYEQQQRNSLQRENKYYDSWHNGQERQQHRLIDEYEQPDPTSFRAHDDSETYEIGNRYKEMELLNEMNAKEISYLKTQNAKLQGGQAGKSNHDREKSDILKLLQSAQQLCRELDREKNSLQIMVDQLKFENQCLIQNQQVTREMPGQQTLIPVLRERMTSAVREEDFWRTKCNKLEKQLEIEHNLVEKNQQELNHSFQFSIHQQKEIYEMQIQTMKQIVDSKIKETEDLRQFNQGLAQQLNQQLIQFQNQIVQVEQSRVLTGQPQQNSQYMITIHDLSAQLQNMQQLLQLKCMECDQLKSKILNQV